MLNFMRSVVIAILAVFLRIEIEVYGQIGHIWASELACNNLDLTGWINDCNLSPATDTCFSTTFYGNFWGTCSVTKVFDDMPTHLQLRINFTLFILDAWNNNTLSMAFDNTIFYTQTFNYLTDTGSSQSCGSSVPDLMISQSSGVIMNTDTNPQQLQINTNLSVPQSQASWGLCNLTIEIICSSGQIYYDNQCLSCPDSTWADIENNSCQNCTSPCVTCSGAAYCLSCEQDYFLKDSGCFQSCGDGYWQNNFTQTCETCLYSCETCTEDTVCQSCKALYYKTPDHECVVECNATLYNPDNSLFICNPKTDNSMKNLIILIISIVAGCLALLLGIFIIVKICNRMKHKKREDEEKFNQILFPTKFVQYISDPNFLKISREPNMVDNCQPAAVRVETDIQKINYRNSLAGKLDKLAAERLKRLEQEVENNQFKRSEKRQVPQFFSNNDQSVRRSEESLPNSLETFTTAARNSSISTIEGKPGNLDYQIRIKKKARTATSGRNSESLTPKSAILDEIKTTRSAVSNESLTSRSISPNMLMKATHAEETGVANLVTNRQKDLLPQNTKCGISLRNLDDHVIQEVNESPEKDQVLNQGYKLDQDAKNSKAYDKDHSKQNETLYHSNSQQVGRRRSTPSKKNITSKELQSNKPKQKELILDSLHYVHSQHQSSDIALDKNIDPVFAYKHDHKRHLANLYEERVVSSDQNMKNEPTAENIIRLGCVDKKRKISKSQTQIILKSVSNPSSQILDS